MPTSARENNDIAGYWGIGMLCASSRREAKPKFSFKIYPGQLIKIYGREVTDSHLVTDKLVKFGLDSIECRLSFFKDGRYPHGAEKFTCGIAIAITQGGRTGLSLSHIECWPHDPRREVRRGGFADATESWAARFVKNFRQRPGITTRLQWTGPASGVLVDSSFAGAVPAIDRIYVRLLEELTLLDEALRPVTMLSIRLMSFVFVD